MTEAGPDISVVLNGHREGRQLHATVKSAVDAIARAKDTGLVVELMVVLDSPDRQTVQYCREFLPEEARVLEIALNDLGLARNAAVEAANGEYVAFLDGDDLWAANWLSAAYRFGKADGRELVLHPSIVVYFEGGERVWRLIDQEDPAFSKSVLLEHNLWPSLTFARRATHRSIPFRATKLELGFGYEDWLFHCDTIAGGILHKVVPDTLHAIREKTWKRSLLKQSIASRAIIAETPLFAPPWSR